MPVKGKTDRERGYGYDHKKLRKQIAPEVNAGRTKCWRCGLLIKAGDPWDLGHDDDDRSRYRGPEHQACNRATANRQTSAFGPAVDLSRNW